MANEYGADSLPPVEPTPIVAAPDTSAQSAPADPYAASAAAPPPAAPPPYSPYAQPAAYGQGYGLTPQPTGLSVASMVLGIVGVVGSLFYGLGLFPSIAAVITGHLGRKRQPWAKGMSLAGLIMGYIGIAFSIIGIGILIFVIVLAVSASNSSNFSDFG